LGNGDGTGRTRTPSRASFDSSTFDNSSLYNAASDDTS
jgi:hypothetical protein